MKNRVSAKIRRDIKVTSLALILVLSAAIGHATWNYLTKRANGGATFILLFASISSVLYMPLTVWVGYVC
jgi:TRAP-type C4-dicarboxylate transport system permease small subunit